MNFNCNLLPDWRENFRKAQKQRAQIFIVMLAVVASILVGGTYFIGEKKVVDLRSARQKLEQIIGNLNQQEKIAADFERQINAIQTKILQLNQPHINQIANVELLETLARITPNEVQLSGVEKNGANITIRGVAQSFGAIVELVQKIRQVSWLRSTQLVEVKSNSIGVGENVFVLTAVLVSQP